MPLVVFFVIYFTVLMALTVPLARAALSPRHPRAFMAVSIGALPFWAFMSLVFPGPLLPFLSDAGIANTTTPMQASLSVLPIGISVLAGGGLLTVAAPRQRRVTAAALALSLAAMPTLASVLAFPASDFAVSLSIARQRSSLQTARAKWRQVGSPSYRFSFTFQCFCPGLAGHVFTSEVIDGHATISSQGSGLGGQPPDLTYAQRFSIVDSALSAISGSIGQYDHVEARYDGRTGFPTRFSWGTYEATDSITTIEFGEFETLP